MSRTPLVLAVALSACAAEVTPVSTAEQEVHKPTVAESRQCDPSFCILFTAQDSDHDGVADADEIAAGTAPNDPFSHPSVLEVAQMIVDRASPEFEAGNSMLVLLPTRDANGLPVFGGGAALPARKTGLETLGIKPPDGIDVARGFTMARTLDGPDIAFAQLITAFGHDRDGAAPVRVIADAIGYGSEITVKGDQLDGTTRGGQHLSGSWSSDGKGIAWSVHTDGLTFSQHVTIEKDDAGNITAVTMTDQLDRGTGIRRNVITRNTTTSTGDHTDTTTTTNTEPKEEHGQVEKVCDQWACESDPPEPVDPPDPVDPPPSDDDDTGYIDPEAIDYSGILTAGPDGMAIAITKLGSTILVMPNDNDPLANYEVPPTGAHDAYGPIALYGGDPDNSTILGSFGITPAFVRVVRPEYDPNLPVQPPPKGAPPDGTCLYCFQGKR